MPIDYEAMIASLRACGDPQKHLAAQVIEDLRRDISDGAKWVPTSERLPSEMTYVLAVERQHTHPFVPVVAYYSTKAGRHMLATAWVDSTGEYIDVTHWTPLPEAPK